MNHQSKKSGFTIIELLVVVAIIGMLSGIVLAALQSARLKAHNSARLSDIDQINKAVELYLTKNAGAAFPASTGWECISNPATSCWAAAYPAATNMNAALTGNISMIPKDPAISAGYDGSHYLYNSSFAGTSGTGAYLGWWVNDFGTNSCGRGYTIGTSGEMRQCALFLGK